MFETALVARGAKKPLAAPIFGDCFQKKPKKIFFFPPLFQSGKKEAFSLCTTVREKNRRTNT